jgi:hypothetical protein
VAPALDSPSDIGEADRRDAGAIATPRSHDESGISAATSSSESGFLAAEEDFAATVLPTPSAPPDGDPAGGTASAPSRPSLDVAATPVLPPVAAAGEPHQVKANPWTRLAWWTAIPACLIGAGIQAVDIAIPHVAMVLSDLLTTYGSTGVVGAIVLSALGWSERHRTADRAGTEASR